MNQLFEGGQGAGEDSDAGVGCAEKAGGDDTGGRKYALAATSRSSDDDKELRKAQCSFLQYLASTAR